MLGVYIEWYMSSVVCICFFFFKQKTAYEMRFSNWSSDVCSSDLGRRNPTWSGTVDELRERLGAPSNSMPNFSDFRRLVLTPGKAEIDQLAAFTMDWVERRGARGKITHVTITFYPKD